MLFEPQFPHVAESAGHYESIYLTAHHPSEPVAVWIRYTVHKRPGAAATGSIWFTLFEPGGPTAVKITTDALGSDDAQLIAMDGYGSIRRAVGSHSGAVSSISGHGVDASWELRFEAVAERTSLQGLMYLNN